MVLVLLVCAGAHLRDYSPFMLDLHAVLDAEVGLLPAIEEAADQMFVEIGAGPLPPAASVAELTEAQFVLVAGRPPVGFARVEEVDGVAHLEQLSVHPQHARQGVGGALLEGVCEWAARAGYPAITLITFAEIPWNAPFYRRQGFVPLVELTPGLRDLRRHEAELGLDVFGPRVAMRRMLSATSLAERSLDSQHTDGMNEPHEAPLTDGTIVLRPLGLDDIDAHFAGEDDDLVRWLNGGHGTVESVRAHIVRTMGWWEAGGPIFGFSIRIVPDHTLVGTIDVQLHQPFLSKRQANLAYGIYPAWRRQGIATRAVVLACEFLRRRSDVGEAVIRAEPDNPASAAVARSAGFTFSHRTNDEHGRYDWYLLPIRQTVR